MRNEFLPRTDARSRVRAEAMTADAAGKTVVEFLQAAHCQTPNGGICSVLIHPTDVASPAKRADRGRSFSSLLSTSAITVHYRGVGTFSKICANSASAIWVRHNS